MGIKMLSSLFPYVRFVLFSTFLLFRCFYARLRLSLFLFAYVLFMFFMLARLRLSFLFVLVFFMLFVLCAFCAFYDKQATFFLLDVLCAFKTVFVFIRVCAFYVFYACEVFL